MEFSSSNYCIDLGSTNVRMGSSKNGVILTQASHGITFTDEQGETSILALGNAALEMYNRIPKILRHTSLIKDGSVHDYGCLVELMKQLFMQMQERMLWVNQQVTLCVSESQNDAEKEQMVQVLKQSGVRKVKMTTRLLAIARALELPIEEPQAHCVVDIGGHTTEIGIISCGALIRSRLLKIGGDTFSLALLRYLRKQFDVEVSVRQADRLKENFGAADMLSSSKSVEVIGRSVEEAFPTIKHVPQNELCKGVMIGVEMWLGAVEGFFDELPIELSTDILQTGVVLVGGSAKLDQLDWVLSQRLGLMVITPENPDELSLIGAAQV